MEEKIEQYASVDSIFNEKSNLPQIYINGTTKLPSGTNHRDIKIHAHDEIALIYGIAPANIPSQYNFPEGL